MIYNKKQFFDKDKEELARLRDRITDQLGSSFHLCGLVQRFQGQLQVYVQTSLPLLFIIIILYCAF
jgi:hypothetical protein